MTGFYIAIILFGAFIAAIALVLVFADKSRAHDYRLDVSERRNALVEAMDDADALVGEMNRFADYVATQCEDKRMQVEETIHRADRLVSQVSDACAVLESRLAATREDARFEVGNLLAARAFRTGGIIAQHAPLPAGANPDIASAIDTPPEGDAVTLQVPDASKTPDAQDGLIIATEPEDPENGPGGASGNRGRVLPLHSRRAEVLRLARRGVPHEEIAKTLHMGKGEIDLIARIGSGT